MTRTALIFTASFAAAAIGGCAIVPEPVFESSHPANALAPSATSAVSKGALAGYRDERDFSRDIPVESSRGREAESGDMQQPATDGGHHGKH